MLFTVRLGTQYGCFTIYTILSKDKNNYVKKKIQIHHIQILIEENSNKCIEISK